MSAHYKNRILELSEKLIEIQRPIQILEAVKWPEGVEEAFLKTSFKEIPKFSYEQKPLKYNTQKKLEEFKLFRQEINRELGESDPVAKMLINNCLEYENVVRMLMSRGQPDFYDYSKKLYGSSYDLITNQNKSLHEFSSTILSTLSNLDLNNFGDSLTKNYRSEDVVSELNRRLGPYFYGEKIKVKLSDGILSDAAAGSDYIKIKENLMFSKKDIDIFEVHEGWVHLGTTLNGKKQEYAKFLSKGSPRSTVIQEGLAVIMELFNFAMFPARAKRLTNRIVATKMAEDGANILEVISFYRELGQTNEQALKNASRIFRGACLHGGSPFTKDLSYLKGFLQVYEFMKTSVSKGQGELIPFLFYGKVSLEEIELLRSLKEQNIISEAPYIPDQIRDLSGLAVWLTLTDFLKAQSKTDNEERKTLKAA